MSWFSDWWASMTKPIPTLGPVGKAFNTFQDAYTAISLPTEDTLEIVIQAHKIMLFGSQAKKQAYHDALAKKYGWPPGNVSWENISSLLPEIVGDLRIGKDGKYIINHLCVGHEISHTITRFYPQVLDPDKYATLK